MYENALDTAYRLLMETEYDALGVTIEKIFQNCSGEWNAAIAKKIQDFYIPIDPDDVLIGFSGAAFFDEHTHTIDYLFVIHHNKVFLIDAKLDTFLVSPQQAKSVLKKIINTS